MTFIARSINSVGALLRRWNVTSKRMESVVILTTLRLRIHVNFITVGEKYKLFVFASRDVHDDSAYNPVVLLEHDHWVETPFLLRNKPTLPEFVHLWLFVDGVDDNGIDVQSLLAWGRCRPLDLLKSHQLELKDIEGRAQAVLDLQILNAPRQLQPSPASSLSNSSIESRVQSYLDQVSAVYERFERNDDAYFVYVDTPVGRLPVLSYAVLACQIRQNNDKAVQWLEYLVRITSIRFQRKPDELTRLPELWGELIAEMALWQVRARIYTLDSVRVSSNKKLGSDQWTRIGCFPDAALACGDCEDFSELVLEFLHVFKYCTLPLESSGLLKLLQKQLRQYTPFMAIGQLKAGSAYTCHAYVVLLDTRWVENRIDKIQYSQHQGCLLPSIVIEGTAYTESTWTQKTLRTHSEVTRHLHHLQSITDCPTAQGCTEKWERMIKYRTPAAVVNLEHHYGQVFILMTADYTNPYCNETEALQLLVKRSAQDRASLPRLGCNHSSVALYDSCVRLECALRLNARELEQLNLYMKDLPFSKFQDAPLSQSYLPRLHDRDHVTYSFDMRLVDYKQNKRELKQMFREFQRSLQTDSRISITKVAVSRSLALINVQITGKLANL